jgi:hypothetical protein
VQAAMIEAFAAANVPEPTTLAAALIVGTLLFGRRR